MGLASRFSCLLLCSLAAHAQTLTSTFTFIGSGTIGAQHFTDAEIVIAAAGLASDVSGSPAIGQISLPVQATSISVAGTGVYQISEPVAIGVQISPTGAAPGTSVNQAIYLTISGQNVIAVTSLTSNPWNLLSPYFGAPAFGEGADGSFGFNPPAGQLANWNLLPVLTADGFTVNLLSTVSPIPVTFQATLGVSCNGSPTGRVSDIQSMIREALGAAPSSTDMNGDGVINLVDVQLLTDGVLGCGLNTTMAKLR